MKEQTKKNITKLINILIAIVLIGGMILPLIPSLFQK